MPALSPRFERPRPCLGTRRAGEVDWSTGRAGEGRRGTPAERRPEEGAGPPPEAPGGGGEALRPRRSGAAREGAGGNRPRGRGQHDR
eukprot:2738706-Pyramimonas_sp.AAC.1